MFGKVFEQMYTGSMVGAGTHVYSLWPYMIACCDSDGDVDVHPVAVGAILGAKVEDVKAALEYLLAPDENSRSEEHDGARIVKVLENRYHLVNYEKYRKIKDQDERREQLREAQRRFREKKGLKPVIGNHGVISRNPPVIDGNQPSSAVITRKPRAEGREKRAENRENKEVASAKAPATHVRVFQEEAAKAGIAVVMDKPDFIKLAEALEACGSEEAYRRVCSLWFASDDEWIKDKWGYSGRFIGKKLQALLNNGHSPKPSDPRGLSKEYLEREAAERRDFLRRVDEGVDLEP